MNPDGKRIRANAVVKHSVAIAGHRTSVSLERLYWTRLSALAAERAVSVAQLIGDIDARREGANLSSAVRVFVLQQALLDVARLSATLPDPTVRPGRLADAAAQVPD